MVLDASAWVDVLAGALDLPELGWQKRAVTPHFDAEVVGSVRSLCQRNVITQIAADAAVQRHLRAPFERPFDPADVNRAWQLRETMSFADAWYVAMAERLDATLITADQRMARSATRFVQVALVGPRQPELRSSPLTP